MSFLGRQPPELEQARPARIAFRGLRSSCPSVARNSSFRRLARSAAMRAARSFREKLVQIAAAIVTEDYFNTRSAARTHFPSGESLK